MSESLQSRSHSLDPAKDQFFLARKRMVETQIIDRGVRDTNIINAFLRIPRHIFLNNAQLSQAYDDHPLPIGFGQTISQPYMVALMLENLQVNKSHKVLEIGTGSGYQTLLLAELAGAVYTIERLDDLSIQAQRIIGEFSRPPRFSAEGRSGSGGSEMRVTITDSNGVTVGNNYNNIFFKTGDGTLGWEEFAPFDRIIVSAGTFKTPLILISQLSGTNGILLYPEGDAFTQELIQLRKNNGKAERHSLGFCSFVKLIGQEAWSTEIEKK